MLRRLSNKGEKLVYEQIASAADKYGARVYQKVRIADVMDIDQLRPRPAGTYALQAHFDFVVADDDDMPLFAVEYDGGGHEGRNDAKKDAICQQEGLALFRVNLQTSRIETARMRLLSYLVNLWFLAEAFAEMQETGELPPDEPFVISAFLKPNAKHVFDSEFDLLGPARGKLNRSCRQHGLPGGPMWHLRITEALFAHDEGEFAAFTYADLGDVRLCGRSLVGLKMPCRGKLADVPFARHEIGQFCTALAIEDLVEELSLHRAGGEHVARRAEDVLEEAANLRRSGYTLLLASHGSDDAFAKAILQR